MAGFPTLKPAYTARFIIDPPLSTGATGRGAPLFVVPMVGGSLTSEPSYTPSLSADFIGGYDFIRADPSGSQVRLDVKSVLKDSKTGGVIACHYRGLIAASPEFQAIVAGSPEAKTSEFGDAFTAIEFESGEESLKPLEERVFVTSGRFIIAKGEKTVVEYKISQVCK